MSYALIRHLRRAAMLAQPKRYESAATSIPRDDYLFRPPLAQWSKVIREAEKIVGYPTSFMNLRWLLSDEFANMAMHLRKVVGSNHPILQTAKNLLYNEHNNLQPWGLVILLLSKAVRSPQSTLQSTNIAENQRVLAELTEMIRTGHYVHRGLLNIPFDERDPTVDSSMFANKIAILIGDYLLVTANGMLARLKNQDLSYLISTALRDLSEGEFLGLRDKQNIPIPGKPLANTKDSFSIHCDTLPLDVREALGSPIKEWTLRTMFGGASLLGRGCQGAMLLADQDYTTQEKAYLFGCHLCLAWQATSDLQKFTSETKTSYSLVSAPVLFALNSNPDLYSLIQKGLDNTSDVDLLTLKEEILKTDAVERTKRLYEENAQKATSYAQTFGNSESIDAIKRLIHTA